MKAELAALEKLFEQEINLAIAPDSEKGKCLARLPRSMGTRLVSKGLATESRYRLGRDAFGDITVPCYVLTDLGRLIYCQHASTVEDEVV